MRRAYVGLCLTGLVTAGVVAYVHWDQQREITRMREGVYLDVAREQRRRKALKEQHLSSDSVSGSGNS